MLFGKTPIFVVDSQSFRRLAIASLFASLLSDQNVVVLQCDCIQTYLSSHPVNAQPEGKAPLFIFNACRLGLSDPELTGAIAAVRKVLPDCPVLVMVESECHGGIEQAITLGVNAVISMAMPPRQVIAAVEIALCGGTSYPKLPGQLRQTKSANPIRLVDAPVGLPRQPAERSIVVHPPKALTATAAAEKITQDADVVAGVDGMQLSRRQTDVLKTLQSGMSNKAIARALGLSEATVKIHVRHLMRKFGVGNRTQVAVISQYAPVSLPKATTVYGRFAAL